MDNVTNEISINDRVTFYVRGGCGNFVKTECRCIATTIAPWAQHRAALTVRYVARGARKARGVVYASSPSVVVLAGWGHPDADGMMIGERTEGAVTTSHSRYMSCDPRWSADFDAMLSAYVAKSGARIVADYRNHDTH